MVRRLAIALLLIAMSAYACGNGSTEPKATKAKPAADGENMSKDISAKASEPSLAGISRPGGISKYDKIVRKYARRYLFDWRLISAQIYTESRFKYEARSYRGALGLMQIMPGTAQWLEGKAGKDTPELKVASRMLLNPKVNIHLGCYYDAMLFSRIKNAASGDDRYKMMFAAYNAGPGNLNKARKKASDPESWAGIENHLPEETKKYIPTIYDQYKTYKQWAVLKPY